MLTLANPAGLWALLGIPAVLAIHFLQRQAVILPISTLFLLEKTQRESASGRRFDRLMNSVPLWMQLLGVLLLTWLLAEPRYQVARSTQRIAVVLDSSASMSVFAETLRGELAEALPEVQGAAAAVELTLLESASRRERLYSGASIEDALAALDGWQPRDGLTDPAQALRLARSLVGREGVVIYATDTPVEGAPYDPLVLALGEEVDNVGITGVNFTRDGDTPVWTCLVKNYGSSPASREWWLEFSDGKRTRPEAFEVEAGGITALSGALPDDDRRARLVLDGDRFALDDVMPMQVPRPKTIGLFSATSPAFAELSARLLETFDATVPSDDAAAADLSLVSYDPLDPVLPQGHAVVFVHDATRGGAYLRGGIVAEKHPLVDGLNWQALLVRETIELERLPSDDVLVWQGERPLVFLRQAAGSAERQLCFNFDLRLSNAASQPAFIVCLHRFVEGIRQRKVAGFATNLESGQPVRLAARAARPEAAGDDGGSTADAADPAADGAADEAPPVAVRSLDLAGETLESERREPAAILTLEAPRDPGFLEVVQGDQRLLTAAVHFADTREADFSRCATGTRPDFSAATAVERHTREDHWWRAWVLILVAALLVSWHFTKEPKRVPGPGEPGPANPAPAAD